MGKLRLWCVRPMISMVLRCPHWGGEGSITYPPTTTTTCRERGWRMKPLAGQGPVNMIDWREAGGRWTSFIKRWEVSFALCCTLTSGLGHKQKEKRERLEKERDERRGQASRSAPSVPVHPLHPTKPIIFIILICSYFRVCEINTGRS